MTLKSTLLACCAGMALHGNAQTSENFNSRPGIPLSQVRTQLQSHCWNFVSFDTAPSGQHSPIEGDGSMVSGTAPDKRLKMGIYTPLLDIPGDLSIRFNYFFDTIRNSSNRFFRLYLTDGSNEIEQLLDSISLKEVSTAVPYTYSKRFRNAPSGTYKLFINYGGEGIDTRVAVDQLLVSVNAYYPGGCNTVPVAVNDNINGQANRQASGNILSNDYDPNQDSFSAYIETQPANGTVKLNGDNSFSFSPAPGFSGSTTSFTYRICEDQAGGLCSAPATVTIHFPSTTFMPLALREFSGEYRNNGRIELNWLTGFESNIQRFEVERSTDGERWTKAGELTAAGNSSIQKAYSFIDVVGKNVANKKDLFYRLRQVNNDNRSALSRILIVRVYNNQSVKMVSITPNPAKNDIAVNLQLNQTSMASMKILNNNGSQVYSKIIKGNSGMNNVLLEGTGQLPAGLYVLEVIINSKDRMIVKLIKE